MYVLLLSGLNLIGFPSCLTVLSARGKLLAIMNLAFFGCVFVVVFASEFLLPPQPYLDAHPSFPRMLFDDNFFIMFFGMFLFNLVLSAFIVVTLPGFVFFPLSSAFLLYRAFVWGLLLRCQPTWIFIVALPTLVFEGEGYVFAAVAGTVVGASWVKPKWLYSDGSFTRVEALEKASRECLRVYVFVFFFLLVAAVVETLTIFSWGF